MATKTFKFDTSSVDFVDLFQSSVRPVGVQEFSLEELSEALENVGFFQAELDESKVSDLVKSFIQTGSLYRPLEVLFVKGQPEILYLGGGRHRFAAIQRVISDYSFNQQGQLVEDYADESGHMADGLTAIECRGIVCQVYEVDSLVEVNTFVAASNTSRTHTAVEKLMGDIHVGVASKAQEQLHKLVEELRSQASKYTLTTNTGKVIYLEDNDATLLALAKGLISNVAVIGDKGKKVNKFSLCGDSLINQLAASFIRFVSEEMNSFESNFAREGYKTALKKFAERVSPEAMYNEDGELLPNATYFDWFTNRVLAADAATNAGGKKGKGKNKVAEMEQIVAQMAAEIERLRAANGIQ